MPEVDVVAADAELPEAAERSCRDIHLEHPEIPIEAISEPIER